MRDVLGHCVSFTDVWSVWDSPMEIYIFLFKQKIKKRKINMTILPSLKSLLIQVALGALLKRYIHFFCFSSVFVRHELNYSGSGCTTANSDDCDWDEQGRPPSGAVPPPGSPLLRFPVLLSDASVPTVSTEGACAVGAPAVHSVYLIQLYCWLCVLEKVWH